MSLAKLGSKWHLARKDQVSTSYCYCFLLASTTSPDLVWLHAGLGPNRTQQSSLIDTQVLYQAFKWKEFYWVPQPDF